jgi:hypothetical protein
LQTQPTGIAVIRAIANLQPQIIICLASQVDDDSVAKQETHMDMCQNCREEFKRIEKIDESFVAKIPNGIGQRGGIERFAVVWICQCNCGICERRYFVGRPYA